MIVVTIALLVAAGWPLAAALDPEANGFRRAGESLLLGSAAAVIVLELLAIAGIRWNRPMLLLPLASISIAAGLLSRRRVVAGRAIEPTGSRLWYALDAISATLVVAHLRFSSLERPYEWDFFGIWGFKAHLFFTERSISWPTLVDPNFDWVQAGHPLFAPLLYDVDAIVAGRWDDTRLGLFATVFAVALILIVRGEVAAVDASRLRRSAITLAVTPAALSIWIGLSEAFLIAFATAGLLLLRRGLRDSSPTALRAAAVFLGCAVMTKNEGMAFVIAAVFGILVASRARFRAALQLWPAVVIAAPWFVIRHRVSATTGVFDGAAGHRLLSRLMHPSEILETIWTMRLTNHVFWWAAAVTIILFGRELWRNERFLLVVVVALSAAYIAQNFLVPWRPETHIIFGLSRLLDQCAAIVAFAAAAVLTRSGGEVAAVAAPNEIA